MDKGVPWKTAVGRGWSWGCGELAGVTPINANRMESWLQGVPCPLDMLGIVRVPPTSFCFCSSSFPPQLARLGLCLRRCPPANGNLAGVLSQPQLLQQLLRTQLSTQGLPSALLPTSLYLLSPASPPAPAPTQLHFASLLSIECAYVWIPRF